jgi:two-component system response regulator AtoC
MTKTERRHDADRPLMLDTRMQSIFEMLEKIARTQIPVLLLGETGVGKEVIAEWVHQRSACARTAMVKLNCAGLTESVVESELFGHERGAFTGAIQAHEGLFERAHAGTLLLDEVGELPPRTQAKLLRVLESGELLRVGGTRPREVSVRVIAATHRDLGAMVERGEFRQDLFFRLNAITIEVPPLRERAREIVPFAQMFLERCARQTGCAAVELEPCAVSALQAHHWPGNIRELRNVIERAAATTTGTRIQREALGLDSTARRMSSQRAPIRSRQSEPGPAPGDIRSELRAFERARIVAALESTMGNQTRAARLLGVSRRTLSNKLAAHRLDRPRRGLIR